MEGKYLLPSDGPAPEYTEPLAQRGGGGNTGVGAQAPRTAAGSEEAARSVRGAAQGVNRKAPGRDYWGTKAGPVGVAPPSDP